MRPIINYIEDILKSGTRWKAYENSEFLLQQKVVFTVFLAILIISPGVLAYTFFIDGVRSLGILIPEVGVWFIAYFLRQALRSLCRWAFAHCDVSLAVFSGRRGETV